MERKTVLGAGSYRTAVPMERKDSSSGQTVRITKTCSPRMDVPEEHVMGNNKLIRKQRSSGTHGATPASTIFIKGNTFLRFDEQKF
ncbi:MAG: hypothetical protein V4717_05595 [Bacteroidota bacterium]